MKQLSAPYSENQRLPQYLLHHASEAILITDLSLRITGWNRVAESFYGLCSPDTREQHPPIIDLSFRPAEPDKSMSQVFMQLRERHYWQGVLQFNRPDRQAGRVMAGMHLLTDGGGIPVRIVILGYDLTGGDTNLPPAPGDQKQIIKVALAAQELERNEISKELHDNVNQLLITSRLYIEMGRKNLYFINKNEPLEKAEAYISQAIEEIRKLSRSLNASFLEEIGLEQAIAELVKNIRSTQSLKVRLQADRELDEKIPGNYQLVLFRILQEQTSNIIKYAQASVVTISIRAGEETLELLIGDDGLGFDIHQTPKGVGLTNICNRVEAFNGRVFIQSAHGEGCTLKVELPLPDGRIAAGGKDA